MNVQMGVADNCDAMKMMCAVCPGFMRDTIQCHGSCITDPGETYGQVIFYDGGMLAGMGPGFDAGYYGKKEPNCTVIREINNDLYKQRLEALLTKE